MALVQTFSDQPNDIDLISNPRPRTQCEISRVTGYYNSFDDALAYSKDVFQTGGEMSSEPICLVQSAEVLPEYSCSVRIEGSLSMKVERMTPFDALESPQWSDVYVVLQGTLLEIHRIKSRKYRGKATTLQDSVHSAGQLIKNYTLQHAEAGLAADHKKVELVPRSALTRLLPGPALEQLRLTEPQLFQAVKQYVVRLRLENEQLLFRFVKKEDRLIWLSKLCAAIDIAPPLEYRAEPKYHTLPRRRRRDVRTQLEDVSARVASLIEAQERFLAEHFSALQLSGHEQAALHGSGTERFRVDHDDDLPSSTNQDPDADDLDTGFVIVNAEYPTELHPNHRTAIFEEENHLPEHPQLSSSITSIRSCTIDRSDMPTPTPASPGHNKFGPADPIDAARETRYQRLCQPALLFHSRRATDFIICNGQQMHIDWENQVLRPHPEPSPPYQRLDGASSKEKSPVSTVLHQILVQSTTSTSARGNKPSLSSFSKRPLLRCFASPPVRSSTNRSSSGSPLSSTWKDVASWTWKLKLIKGPLDEDRTARYLLKDMDRQTRTMCYER